eukprot:COSAG01_NODE_38124_length_494_cov_0.592405_1_plen_104_part_10
MGARCDEAQAKCAAVEEATQEQSSRLLKFSSTIEALDAKLQSTTQVLDQKVELTAAEMDRQLAALRASLETKLAKASMETTDRIESGDARIESELAAARDGIVT